MNRSDMTHLEKLRKAYEKVSDAMLYEPLTWEMREAHLWKKNELYREIETETAIQFLNPIAPVQSVAIYTDVLINV